jgi:hypothetical protein
MLGAGSLDLLSKSLDKIDDNLGAIKTRQSEFEDRLLTLEQRRDGGDLTGEHSGLVKTLGSQFLESFEKKSRAVRKDAKRPPGAEGRWRRHHNHQRAHHRLWWGWRSVRIGCDRLPVRAAHRPGAWHQCG